MILMINKLLSSLLVFVFGCKVTLFFLYSVAIFYQIFVIFYQNKGIALLFVTQSLFYRFRDVKCLVSLPLLPQREYPRWAVDG